MQVSAATGFCLVSLIIQLKSAGDATKLREHFKLLLVLQLQRAG